MKILCIGRPAYDITLPMDTFPRENTKAKVYKKFECGGGSASNCAYLLGKWGEDVGFCGNLGNDDYGKRIIDEFKSVGVNIDNINILNMDTPIGYILSNMDKGTRTIITYSSNYEDMPYKESMKAKYILCDGYYPDAVKKVFSNPDTVKIIDAGKLDENSYELASYADYVVCSKNFAEDVTGIKIDAKKTKKLELVFKKMKANFKGEIIITLESAGCAYYDKKVEIVPTLKVTSVDTTGAGDIFHGAFVYAISNEYPLKEALKIANITGALSCRYIGGRQSVPELGEVLEVYKNFDKVKDEKYDKKILDKFSL